MPDAEDAIAWRVTLLKQTDSAVDAGSLRRAVDVVLDLTRSFVGAETLDLTERKTEPDPVAVTEEADTQGASPSANLLWGRRPLGTRSVCP
ncbi:MAG: hypothetical protein ACRD0Z_00610 [Acidimicrobiales bacterium]